MLQVEHISFAYRKKQVLRDVSFTADAGAFIGIIGKNGCGKSTLLSVLAGVRQPDGGSVCFQGAPLFSKGNDAADIVGYVPQLNPLLPELSVRDNLKLWLRNKADGATEDVTALYAQMGLTDYMNVAVSKLSEGMKKRVSITSVLQNHPQILILDEPSAALDLPCKEIIHNQLLSFTKNGGIILFTTHEEAEFSLCTTLYILKDGVLVPAKDSEDRHALIQQF